MSNVPPTGRPHGQEPHKRKGEEPSKLGKHQKDFKLPDKEKDKDQGDGEVMSDALKTAEQLKQQVGEETKAEALEKNTKTAKIEAAAVKQIGDFIARNVESLNFGKVQQTEHASMVLAKAGDIPEVFAGSNLSMTCTNGALTIHFDNFMTPQQQDQAFNMVRLHQDELQTMVQRLNARGITVAEMSIGTHRVAIPQAEQVIQPSPFQPPSRSEAEAEAQRQQAEERRDAGEDRT